MGLLLFLFHSEKDWVSLDDILASLHRRSAAVDLKTARKRFTTAFCRPMVTPVVEKKEGEEAGKPLFRLTDWGKTRAAGTNRFCCAVRMNCRVRYHMCARGKWGWLVGALTRS